MASRISNRIYPAIKCKQSSCARSFHPTDKRQVFCCPQHRIDYNNDERKKREAPFLEHNKVLNKNIKILKKIIVCDIFKQDMPVNKQLLQYEGFDFYCQTDCTVNEQTNQKINWCQDYGIEPSPTNQLAFYIRKRANK